MYHYYKDLWEYNPVTDSWTQKANFPGAAIYEGVGFAIGNYGYVGTGIDSSFNRYNQFYKYDPVSNTWSSIAALPTTPRYEAFAASSATKGYVGLSHSIYDNFYPKDLWEYNPSTNTWLALPDLDTTKVFASACVIQNKLYILGGCVFPYVGDSSGSADVIQFDLNTHTWQYINAPNIKRIGGGAAVANNKGYIGLGWNGSFALWTDLWEFSPSGSSSVSNVEENQPIATLYPLPAKHYLNVHLDQNLQGGHIAFFTMQGSCVKQITIPNSSSDVYVSLDHLCAGLYTYSITSTEGRKQDGILSIQE